MFMSQGFIKGSKFMTNKLLTGKRFQIKIKIENLSFIQKKLNTARLSSLENAL